MIKRFLQSWLIDAFVVLSIILVSIVLFRPELKDAVFAWMQSHVHIFEQISLWLELGKTTTGKILTPTRIGVFGAVAASLYFLIWRTLWRMRRGKVFTSTNCPKCDTPMQRINRTLFQKYLSEMVPMRRFYCKPCKKKHLRIKPFFQESPEPETKNIPSTPDRIHIKYS